MGLMTMAQHRQAPRQFKEEPGHDSVSATLPFFSMPCDAPPITETSASPVATAWSLVKRLLRAVVPRECKLEHTSQVDSYVLVPPAWDKFISRGVTAQPDIKNHEAPMLPLSHISLLSDPRLGFAIVPENCMAAASMAGDGWAPRELQGADLFHQQPGLR
ncbi:hypothetical protein VTI74DRAFT_3823 [Chaetomium olivicolor]